MDEVTAKVAGQYFAYPYPKPFEDLEAARNEGRFDSADPSFFGPLLWPEGRPRPDLDILVAGCGTQQAALLAVTNPECRVVGVDLSPASLAHERFLQEKHGLSNLQLFQGDLREIGKLERDFDLVVSSGVLHHLADPGEGLRALKGVLRPDGAMSLMVYGAMARTGVYFIQDACRRLGLGPDAEGVATVRAMLSAVPQGHPVQAYLARAPELEHDAAIVDTFLHPQDRAYSVPHVLEWLEENGLGFQTWHHNNRYYPDSLIEEPLRGVIQRLPVREQWAVVEAVQGVLGKQQFVARHQGKAVSIDLSRPDWLDHRPHLHPEAWLDGERGLQVQEYSFALSDADAAALAAVDGAATLSAIIDLPAFAGFARSDREAYARSYFSRLWRIGGVMFEVPPAGGWPD